MKQIELDETTWDWKFTNGSLTFIVDGPRVAQANKQALQTFYQEYFLDTRYGVPYFEYIFVKNPDYERISSELKTAILRDPQIDEITELNLELDDVTRELTITYSATLTSGEVIEDVVEVNLNE